MRFLNKRKYQHLDDYFTLWISDDNILPELQYISIKSMMLTGHDVTLYTYNELENVPDGVNVKDGNSILDKDSVFKYREGYAKGSYSGFADWFRLKRMYEKGGSWFDCDIIPIKNINDINKNETIISSEPTTVGVKERGIYPTNAFLRIPKNKFLKALLEKVEIIGSSAKHCEGGPTLLLNTLNDFPKYKKYLTPINFISSMNLQFYLFLARPERTIPFLNQEEVFGFHIWNTVFEREGINLESIIGGLYFDLKQIILESTCTEEYYEKLSLILNKN